MRITELNFFKFLKQADIVYLINYVEDNRSLLETDAVDEIQFLYELWKLCSALVAFVRIQ